MMQESELSVVIEELRALEPIFHTAAFGTSPADFERRMSHDYCEVGASGRRYTRAFILQHLREHPPVDAGTAGWSTGEHAVRHIADDTFLLTYELHQHERVTQRTTLWQRAADGWQILFHQGTIVSHGELHG